MEADLEFKYHGSRAPTLNRAWPDALATATNSPGGLCLFPNRTRSRSHTTNCAAMGAIAIGKEVAPQDIQERTGS